MLDIWRAEAGQSLRRSISFAGACRAARQLPAENLAELDADGWEPYHVAEDFAESHDVGKDNRARLD